MGAVSQGSAGGIPGLNLKAWAFVRADGTLIRGMNIASVAKGVAGTYTANFTAAMAGTDYVVRFTGAIMNGPQTLGFLSSRAVGAAGLRTQYVSAASNVDADATGLWEFYE